MNIDDIRESISNMSDEQLMLILRDIRSNRRVSKKQHKQSGSEKAKTKSMASISLSSLVHGLSKDQISELIVALQKESQ